MPQYSVKRQGCRIVASKAVGIALAMDASASPIQSTLAPAGVQAARILDLWHLTLAVCSIVFAAVLSACFIALLRAPQARRDTPPDLYSIESPEPRLRRSVIVATVISAVLLFGLVLADVLTDRALSRLPVANAVHIELTGHQWWWEAHYLSDDGTPGFTLANELHVPVGRPVVVSLVAADVIHTFWAPNLHGKKDMIPGRNATIEFRADRAGTYRGQCAEFCGYEHALMAFLVVADPPADYNAWAARQREGARAPSSDLEAHGQQLFMMGTCARCHAIEGTSATGRLGPDLTHLASRRTLAAGTLTNDRESLAHWITDPRALKPAAMMPPTHLAPADLQALVAYLGTLQ
ncbi:cytochrome c, monohem [Caballeronia terrestris]|uniref:cytochrome-c oxidase n=1 Tax=Caballeronia terrestris TaxID=1226301 RepID=A0A158KA03_9BURK|nr:cytochrome c oxidase subunit II [Caballeronia terrestris]SAL77380.1 cytochrome c, monohem [Caballeronia terrestris]